MKSKILALLFALLTAAGVATAAPASAGVGTVVNTCWGTGGVIQSAGSNGLYQNIGCNGSRASQYTVKSTSPFRIRTPSGSEVCWRAGSVVAVNDGQSGGSTIRVWTVPNC